MRSIAFISLLLVALGCGTTNHTAMQPNKLNGTWMPVKQELGGKLLPKKVYETETLVMNDSTYTLSAESVDKGIVTYGEEKMDIYGKDGVNAGKHFTAIYKLENDLLMICYNLAGDGYPETFETAGKPMYFLSVFQKSR